MLHVTAFKSPARRRRRRQRRQPAVVSPVRPPTTGTCGTHEKATLPQASMYLQHEPPWCMAQSSIGHNERANVNRPTPPLPATRPSVLSSVLRLLSGIHRRLDQCQFRQLPNAKVNLFASHCPGTQSICPVRAEQLIGRVSLVTPLRGVSPGISFRWISGVAFFWTMFAPDSLLSQGLSLEDQDFRYQEQQRLRRKGRFPGSSEACFKQASSCRQ